MKNNNQNGLTLIEAIISIVILVVIMTSAISVFRYAAAINVKQQYKRIAMEIANSKMESIKAMPYSSIDSESSSSVTIGGIQGSIDVSVNTVDDPPGQGSDYKNVTVTLNWIMPDNNETQVITLNTFIAP